MGEDEVAQQRVLLKPLRERSEQESLSQQDVPARLQGLLALVPAG
jgi:hypothetical protein